MQPDTNTSAIYCDNIVASGPDISWPPGPRIIYGPGLGPGICPWGQRGIQTRRYATGGWPTPADIEEIERQNPGLAVIEFIWIQLNHSGKAYVDVLYKGAPRFKKLSGLGKSLRTFIEQTKDILVISDTLSVDLSDKDWCNLCNNICNCDPDCWPEDNTRVDLEELELSVSYDVDSIFIHPDNCMMCGYYCTNCVCGELECEPVDEPEDPPNSLLYDFYSGGYNDDNCGDYDDYDDSYHSDDTDCGYP